MVFNLKFEDKDEETDPELQNVDPDRKKGQTGAKNSGNGTILDDDGYLKFQMPWSFSIGYGINMRENTTAEINPKTMRYPYEFTHTLNFSGNLRISEGWNITFTSGYDFNYNQLSMTTASLTRSLHCFSMSCSMVLMPYRSFNFNFLKVQVSCCLIAKKHSNFLNQSAKFL